MPDHPAAMPISDRLTERIAGAVGIRDGNAYLRAVLNAITDAICELEALVKLGPEAFGGSGD